MAVYLQQLRLPISGIPFFYWHAHEMIYGYAMAMIAGFLLTAAQNWTGVKTLHGAGLAGLFTLWLMARIMFLPGTAWMAWAAVPDMLFCIGLFAAIAQPVIKVRQKRQAPVLIILALLVAANASFYLSASGLLGVDARWGIYGGFYLVLGLVLFMGRRVIPFFTRGGVQEEARLTNSRWVDIASWLLFPAFALAAVMQPMSDTTAVLAGGLFILITLRLIHWHTRGIWSKPLLWSLFLSLVFIDLGFLLHALASWSRTPLSLATHAIAIGGIGTVTISMMPRVSLGHSGRNVHEAPPSVRIFVVSMFLAAVCRVMLPMLDPERYTAWVTASAIWWMIAFFVFAAAFIPILIRPRIDGKPG
jgi:uncharacterized protein involved in response to NO